MPQSVPGQKVKNTTAKPFVLFGVVSGVWASKVKCVGTAVTASLCSCGNSGTINGYTDCPNVAHSALKRLGRVVAFTPETLRICVTESSNSLDASRCANQAHNCHNSSFCLVNANAKILLPNRHQVVVKAVHKCDGGTSNDAEVQKVGMPAMSIASTQWH